MTTLADKIRSKAYWEVVIRPQRFVADRIDYAELENSLSAAAVRMRGWPVPLVDNRVEPVGGEDWVGQDIDAEMVGHYEAWRFYTSGQFLHLRAVSADWRSNAEATSTPPGFASVIEVWEILYYVTEVFELAARLALSPAGDDPMVIEIGLAGLEGRALVVGMRDRADFAIPHRARAPAVHQVLTLSREHLVGEAQGEAVRTASQFFARFGWHPSSSQLMGLQGELTKP